MWQIAAAQFLSSALGAGSEAKQARRMANQQNKQVIADNAAVVESNLENTIRTGAAASLLNVRLGQSRKALIQSGFDRTAAAEQALGAVNANAAAAGTVGASVKAVANDVRMKLGEAKAEADDEWDLTKLNFNTDLTNVIYAGKDSLRRSVGMVASSPSSGDVLRAGIMGAVTGTLGSWVKGQSQLGLGTPTPKPSWNPVELRTNSGW